MSRVLRLTAEQFNTLKRKRVEAFKPRTEPKEYADGWPIVLRDQIVSAGLPEPVREHMFHNTRGWRCDLAWIDRKLAVEVDGAVHRIKGRFAGDIEKHNALVLAGWRWLRVTPGMVRSGDALELVTSLVEPQ